MLFCIYSLATIKIKLAIAFNGEGMDPLSYFPFVPCEMKSALPDNFQSRGIGYLIAFPKPQTAVFNETNISIYRYCSSGFFQLQQSSKTPNLYISCERITQATGKHYVRRASVVAIYSETYLMIDGINDRGENI